MLDTTVSVGVEQPQVLPVLIVSGLPDLIWQPCCFMSIGSFFWPKKFAVIPVDTAVIKPATGLTIVITGSSIAQETAMESTPDSGVAIINERAAPLFAPCFFKPVTTGMTPHDHRGMGIPNRADKNTGLTLPVPRYFFILSALKKT